MTYLKKKLTSFLLATIILGVIFFSIYYLNVNIQKPPLEVPKQESALNVNETALNLMSMGNKRMIASLLWVHTLLESDLDHYKKKDLNSWMYLRFRSIIATDPHFYEAYYYGSQYLSVIKDDDLGAADLLDRGLKVYPDDFWLNYYLGFHSYFELGDTVRAFEAYSRIQNSPLVEQHIPYLPSLMSRLKAEQGDLPDAYKLLTAAYLKIPEGNLKRKYAQSLYAIKAQIDLECLNNRGEKSCELLDWEGHPYKKNSKKRYYAQQNWQPFQISAKVRFKK